MKSSRLLNKPYRWYIMIVIALILLSFICWIALKHHESSRLQKNINNTIQSFTIQTRNKLTSSILPLERIAGR